MRHLLAVFFLCATAHAAEVTHWHDEAGQRYLTMSEDKDLRRVDFSFRWAYDPGALPGWTGDGVRRGDKILFAMSAADEGADREPFFFAIPKESRVEITFRSDKPDQPDPGIRGTFQRLSNEKRLQLAKKEFQAAEERLALAWQNTVRDGRHDDKSLVSDWKAKWPALRQRWLSLSYAPAGVKPEDDPDFWIRLAQATMFARAFNEQRVDVKNNGGWAGDYDDGFGGRVTIRERKEGGLRVNLNCTRGLDGNEANGSDIAGDIPAGAVKKKGDLRTAEAIFDFPGLENEPARRIRVTLQRRSGGLWVETTYLQPTNRKGWHDGIYRWMPVPEVQ
ncbi:MAG: hypothetical protein JNG86_22350 [Verrucomicrobiaceae bacterium]|nr:hypothetical protein [Verrucomicrobiaceae bacterium]